MGTPPRKSDSPLLNHEIILSSLIQGASILTSLMAIYLLSLYRGQGEEDARTLTFTSLVFSNLTLILTRRKTTLKTALKNRWTQTITLTSITLLVAVLYQPHLRKLFQFSTLHSIDWVICLSAGGFSVIWFSGLKKLTQQA
jgi:Ca2+-transporting ATPase